MFLRFSKTADIKQNRIKKYRKAIFLDDSVVMEYGTDIVGAARLQHENEKNLQYIIVVAKNCELGSASIARFIKDMIGKSNKFSDNPTSKRRQYFVDEVDSDVLPIKAKIEFLNN